LRETVNGITTTFTMDLNTGLTQALSDGTNHYIYGLGRIAQVNSNGTEYFLTDALGSVRQLTNGQGEVTLANAYEPYGVLAQTAGSAQTSYGFTGEFTDPSGMVYLRARYYMPTDGRFLTRDTWDGNMNSPLSFNRWMYVEGNPINYTDPSGLCGLPGEPPCPPPGQRENGAGALPDWWVTQTQLYVEGLGYFDSGHLERGWVSARFFVEEVEATLKRGGGVFNKPATSSRWNRQKQKLEVIYSVYYSISVQAARDYKDHYLDRDQIFGMAYGMYIDFERGYEEYQSSRIFPYNLSGFAPADLPSDHLGFWAYMSGYEINEIPSLLLCLGEVEIIFPQLWGIVFDSTGIAENREFLPMIREPIVVVTSKGYKTRNIAWPAFFEIQPIPSGPNTWQKVSEWHK
jgi:RHS repeat-associated protein